MPNAQINFIPLTRVCDCGTYLELRVLSTPAGYYLGFWCPSHGPYSRETGYVQSKKLADAYLNEVKGV